MKRPRPVSALLLSLACAGNASGALIATDLYRTGDKLLTYDSATGLEWLDLTESVGSTLPVIAHEIKPGGAYEGFTLASMASVKTLFTDAGWSGNWGSQGDGADHNAALMLISMLGQTAETSDSFQTSQMLSGRVADILVDEHISTSIAVYWGRSSIQQEAWSSFSWSPWTGGWGSNVIGAYLYRPAVMSPVPEPGATTLMLSGLIAIAALYRRRRRGI